MTDSNLKKQHMNIKPCTDAKVYCTRPDFRYNCDYTPNNCTECPVMRFHYHDLINRILDEESAHDLEKMVEDAGVFSGKYDGEKDLPKEAWSVIYAIRQAYFKSHGNVIDPKSEFESYHAPNEPLIRFREWFFENGTYKGIPVKEAIRKLALEEIVVGRWIATARNERNLCLEEDSGIYKPAVFDDAADGLAYLTYSLEEECEKKGFHESQWQTAVSVRDYEYKKEATYMTVFAAPSSYIPFPEIAYERQQALNNVSYILKKIEPVEVAYYQSNYVSKVIKMYEENKL